MALGDLRVLLFTLFIRLEVRECQQKLAKDAKKDSATIHEANHAGLWPASGSERGMARKRRGPLATLARPAALAPTRTSCG